MLMLILDIEHGAGQPQIDLNTSNVNVNLI